eukprot:scaffold2618_cov189-Skeletonema_marinoi.AAC.1
MAKNEQTADARCRYLVAVSNLTIEENISSMSRSAQSNTNLLDRPLGRSGGRVGGSSDATSVSLSAFAYVYSELVQYHQGRAASVSELERRLESAGYGVGLKVLELVAYRSKEDLGQLSADAYVSGIIAGVLDGAGFSARVTAHSVDLEDGEYSKPNTTGMPPRKDKAVFLVKFSPEVLSRDAALDR